MEVFLEYAMEGIYNKVVGLINNGILIWMGEIILINKKKIAIFVCILIFIGNIILPKTVTRAEADITPPEFKSIIIDKTTVAAGESIKVTVTATDNGGSGIGYISVYYQSPITKKYKTISLKNINGDIYEGTLTLSSTDESGIWQITDVIVRDNSSNYIDIYNSKLYPTYALAQDFSNCNFHLTGTTADTTPPEFKSISIDKTFVAAGESIKVTVTATDNGGSGIGYISVYYRSPITKKYKTISLKNINGDIYEGTLTLSSTDESGIWQITDIIVRDNSSNYIDIYNSKLYPTYSLVKDFSNCNFELREKTTDITPPELKSINIDKTSAVSEDSVKINVEAADDIPGTLYVTVNYQTPITKSVKQVYLNLENGLYSGKIDITSKDERGIWKISSIILTDASLNKIVINNSNLGFTESGARDLCGGDFNVQSTVSFNTNGGTVADSQNIDYYAQAVMPPVPVKAGYAFAGWYCEAGLTTPYDFASPVTADLILYARWTVKEDINMDGKIDIKDIAELAVHYNGKSDVTGWKAAYDINQDGIVDIYDLAIVSKVMGNILVQSVSLDKTTLTLKVGDIDYFGTEITPIDATNQDVEWKSSNPDVATVDSSGKVVAVSEGETIITVTTRDGDKTASCNITVTSPSNRIKVDTVISQDTTINCDIIIAPGARLTINSGAKLIVNGNIYVYGELYNYGYLNVTNTLYTNNYNNMLFGDSTLSTGIFMNFGSATVDTLSTYFPKGYSEN